MPARIRNMVISDAEETSHEEMGMLSDGRGNRIGQELPDLDRSCSGSQAINKLRTASELKIRVRGRKERNAWEWEKRDLPPQEVSHMPHSLTTQYATCHQV